MLKRGLFLLVAFSAAFLQTNVAFAELKVGVFDNRQILDNLPMVEKEMQKLSAEFEPKQKEINNLKKKLLALKEDIEKNAPILSAKDLQAKQLEYQSSLQESQLKAGNLERLINARRNEVSREIQSTVEQEVLKVAKEENYDLVLRSGVLFASPKVDITQKVLKRLSGK